MLDATHPTNLCTICTVLKSTDQGLSFCCWHCGSIFICIYTANSGKSYTA